MLSIADVARIRRVSVRTIRRDLQAGRFAPLPMPRVGKTSALQWSREALRDYVEGGYRKHERRGQARKFFGKARQSAV